MSSEFEHYLSIIKDFDHLMLVTSDQQGGFRARPMRIRQVDPDGGVWFITSIESTKTDELTHEPAVAAVGQRNRRYVSITGVAELVRDKAQIDRLWSADEDAWFELGREDPDVVAIHLVPTQAEYWDRSGTKAIREIVEVAKSRPRGQRLSPEEIEEHAKLQL